MRKASSINKWLARISIVIFIALSSLPFYAYAQTNEKYAFTGKWQLKMYEKTTLKRSVDLAFDVAGTGIDSDRNPFIWGWHGEQLVIRTLSEDWLFSIVPIDDVTFNVQAEITQLFDESALSDYRKQLGLKSSVTLSGFMKKRKAN